MSYQNDRPKWWWPRSIATIATSTRRYDLRLRLSRISSSGETCYPPPSCAASLPVAADLDENLYSSTGGLGWISSRRFAKLRRLHIKSTMGPVTQIQGTFQPPETPADLQGEQLGWSIEEARKNSNGIAIFLIFPSFPRLRKPFTIYG